MANPIKLAFRVMDQTYNYLYHFPRIPFSYPKRPLGNDPITCHWGKGSADIMHDNLLRQLINFNYADHTRDLINRRSTTVTLHFLNKVLIAWYVGKQLKSDLHSTIAELNALTSGAKSTLHYHNVVLDFDVPLLSATPTG